MQFLLDAHVVFIGDACEDLGTRKRPTTNFYKSQALVLVRRVELEAKLELKEEIQSGRIIPKEQASDKPEVKPKLKPFAKRKEKK